MALTPTPLSPCCRTVRVKGGQCLAATRHCGNPVAFVDALGNHFCARHRPDAESIANRERIAAVLVARRNGAR